MRLSYELSNFIRLGRFSIYRPSFPVYFETSHYILKTASKLKEFTQVFRLRYNNFLESTSGQRPWNLDIDQFDKKCDHIIIIHKKSKKVIGTYRVLCSVVSNNFYSETEFNLEQLFKETKGIRLELGRACIDEDFRDGKTLDILWKGIGRYSQVCGADVLFGCSSIKTMSYHQIAKLISVLREKKHLIEGKIDTLEDFKFTDFEMKTQYCDDKNIPELIPPLLRMYLLAGAKVCDSPALDRDFNCTDLFTVLDLKNLNDSFKRRYFGN